MNKENDSSEVPWGVPPSDAPSHTETPSDFSDAEKQGERQVHLPEWFRERQQENYRSVLAEELALIEEDPDAYCSSMVFSSGEKGEDGKEQMLSWEEAKKQYGISSKEIVELTHEAQEMTKKDFSFEKLGERAAALLHDTRSDGTPVEDGFRQITQTIVRRTHRTVLKRMVSEYLPRRKVYLHRGSFKPLREKLFGTSAKQVAERLDHLGSLGLLAKFILKDPAYRIEEISQNLQEGIGGFEFDVRLNAEDQPVVTHAHSSAALQKAPSLDQLCTAIRDLLPEDPQAPREARRGLTLFLHWKTSSKNHTATEEIIRTLDRYGLTQQTVIQTGRPEVLYAVDKIEDRLNAEHPGRGSTRFAFQAVPLSEMGSGAEHAGGILKKLGLASRYTEDELRSMTGWADEMHLLDEWPPKGRVLEILKKHRRSTLAVAAATYSKNMLVKAKHEGVGIHIGTFDTATRVEDMLSPDAFGNRPASMITTNRDVVFPSSSTENESS